jgi:hypothetical protein
MCSVVAVKAATERVALTRVAKRFNALLAKASQ